ncbi:putative dehydrogenase protein [Rhizobium etli CFN 42]|uniref:Dehydrogenase protein n=1 Tax=Rhizobium etli (strain ATCC 51251 / DSM 11541 / JCM 21823 / NBRC 15573 / CFN 42) TaxID=347834 RepID=Q2K541_RHIEC|nr:dehydrogenase [Rhizobium etli]ABC92045.1 putative dehydrogenase protein [Rhizobium etli CFN 42]
MPNRSSSWYEEAVICSIDVEKFADGNSDGIGDFVALTEKLTYLSELDEACLKVRPEDMDDHVRISADRQHDVEWPKADVAMGFEEIYIHNVGRNQREFIEIYEREAPPVFRSGATAAASDLSIRGNLTGRPGIS